MPPTAQLTQGGTHRECTVQCAPSPGGTRRSLSFKQECTPADERKSQRKLRLDRNRQAARYAAARAERGAERARPTALDFERRIVDTVDSEQPERSFDMEALDDMILHSQYSRLKDRRDAAATLRGGDGDAEARIAAAVHLMVGRTAYHKWTPAAKERMPCVRCGRRFAVRIDGQVRQHRCFG